MTKTANGYSNFAANLPAITKMAEAMRGAKFFGIPNKDVAFVIACDLFVTGESPMEWNRRNGFISGTPYVPYDAMLAAFQEAGGKMQLLEKSPERAAAKLTFDGHTSEFELTWEQAEASTFPYAGKEKDILAALSSGNTKKLKLKPKYTTPRSRATMLFARMIDDAVRTVAPSANFGRYLSEIVEDFATDSETSSPAVSEATSETETEAEPAEDKPKRSRRRRRGAAGPMTPEAAEAVSEEPVEEPAAETAVAESSETQPGEESETTADEPAAEETDDRVTINIDQELIDEEFRQRILNVISQLKQSGHTEVGKQVKARLDEDGFKNGLYSLTIRQGEELISALEMKQIEDWATKALTPVIPPNEQ